VRQVGDELPELRITPDKMTPVRYAGASGDFNPIHVDDEFAQRVGLPGRILHGLWTMAQVARALTEAGGGPHSLESLRIQFRGMALPDREIAVTGTVSAVEDGRLTVDVAAEQDGKKIVRGGEAQVRL
jgi:acyl dehydratase